jgi:citrate lyase subunit beta/citryl-CoA lyase
MIEKAVASAADVVFLDLEDSVPPDLKVESRATVVRAIRELDWSGKPPAYRVNALDTPFFYRDIIEVVEDVGGALNLIVLPKVGRAEDVYVTDTLLTQIEANVGIERGAIKVEAQIESAEGLVDAERIAQASDRLEALIFGPGDFAASTRMPLESIGSMGWWDEQYPGHRFHYAMARIAVAARAAGLRVIDGPVANFKDLTAFRRACILARGLGYDGKWCIHPSQVPIANEVFAPTDEELAWARKVVDAYREATAAGRGVISVDNTMVDLASIRMAETTIELAQQAGRDAVGETE